MIDNRYDFRMNKTNFKAKVDNNSLHRISEKLDNQNSNESHCDVTKKDKEQRIVTTYQQCRSGHKLFHQLELGSSWQSTSLLVISTPDSYQKDGFRSWLRLVVFVSKKRW